MSLKSPDRTVTVTVTIKVQSTDPGVLGRVGGRCNDGNNRRLIRWVSGFLSGLTWVIVVTVVYDGTSGFCLYELGGGGGDPGLLTRLDHDVRRPFEMVSEVVIDEGFGGSFSLWHLRQVSTSLLCL